MMPFQDLVQASRENFPNLQIKYKDQSVLMKLLAKGLFLNKEFMTSCTRICNTIYLPCHSFIKVHPVSSMVLLLHELAHLHHSKKQACLATLYVIWKFSQKIHFKPHLEIESKNFVHELHKPWLQTSALEQQFNIAIKRIRSGDRPYVDPIFDILDKLIDKA